MTSAAAIAVACVFLGGCSTVLEDASRSIPVASDPPGAVCVVEQRGTPIALIAATPGTARIPLAADTVTIRCAKRGYREGRYVGEPGGIATAAAQVAGDAVADLVETSGLSSVLDPGRIRRDDAITVILEPLAALSNIAYQAPTPLVPTAAATRPVGERNGRRSTR